MSSKDDTRILRGLAAARGYAVGPVFIYRGDGDIPVPEYVVEAGREGDEMLRLRRAIYRAKRELESLVSTLKERTGRDEVKIFECHLMLMEDPLLLGEIEKLIEDSRVNAESAVRRAVDQARQMFTRMNDPYFRERVRDLDDVERRLMKCLMGCAANPLQELKTPSIIVADDLTPSETAQMPRQMVLGFATNGGSLTSHVSLLARAMGVPAVAGLGDVTTKAVPGETVLLDGSAGEMTLMPTTIEILEFRDLVERQKELSEEATSGAPAGTLKDGGEVLLYANHHPGAPFKEMSDLGARGVGLYRSEYLWLSREGEPSEEEQYLAYREVAEFASSISLTTTAAIRVLDIGGDKMVRSISQRSDTRQVESNPFLGNRSIRYLLSHPEVFRTQLRAIFRASAHGKIRIIYPMVSCVDELRASAKVVERVKAELTDEGLAFDPAVPIGAMIEVPSAAIIAGAIAKYVDFFSLGTNDLIQYVMAADRVNDAVAHLYQPTHPAVLGLVRHVIEAAKAAGKPVCVCGESAADPLVGTLWAAMGVDVLSMSPTYIPIMSKLLSRLTRDDLDDYRRTVEAAGEDLSADEMLEICRAWMVSKVPDFANIVL